MSMLFNGVQRFAPNTKLPGISQYLSARLSFVTNGTTAVTIPIPNIFNGPGQIDLSQNATTFAMTSSPYDQNSEFQKFQRFFITQILVRDFSATSAGTASGGLVLQGNISGAFTSMSFSVTTPTTAQLGTTGLFFTYVPSTVNSAQSANQVLNYNTQIQAIFTGGTGVAVGAQAAFTLDIFGVWSQAM